MLCSKVFLIPSPCSPTSRARAAATLAMAEFSRFLISSLSEMAEEAGVVAVVVTGLGITEGMLVMTRLEVVTKLELEVVATLLTVLGEAVWTTGAMP